jgi:phospholipid/cholesterol/gamma-HCH transport system ATP-binding protein
VIETGATTEPTAGVADDSNIVVVEDLHFAYEKRQIFKGLSLKVPRGKVVAILGASGCGKSTLLKLIGGQIKPASGRILVNGQLVPELATQDLYRLRRDMGMMFQISGLFSDLSVYENIAFPLRELTDLPESVIRPLVLMKLHAVGLRGAYRLMPSELSGGMARRVALARAIVMDPELLLYDEPFVGLDPISMGVIARLIESLNRTLGITSIVVSHDVDEMEALADYSYLIADGRVVARGTPKELEGSGEEVVRQFMSGAPDGPVPFHYPAPDYYQQLLE